MQNTKGGFLLEFYQDSVEALRSVFTKLNLIVEGEAAIHLTDPAWRVIANSVWDIDGDGYITEEEAQTSRFFRNFTNDNTSYSNIEVMDLTHLHTGFWRNNQIPSKIKEFRLGICDDSTPPSMDNSSTLEIYDVSKSNIKGLATYTCQKNTRLREVLLPDCLEYIEGYSFYQCTALESIVIPDSVTHLGKSTHAPFQESGLKNVVIGSGVQSMRWAFHNCNQLEVVCIKAVNPPAWDGNCFSGTSCLFYVPDESVEAYKTDVNWSSLASRIKPISEKP